LLYALAKTYSIQTIIVGGNKNVKRDETLKSNLKGEADHLFSVPVLHTFLAKNVCATAIFTYQKAQG